MKGLILALAVAISPLAFAENCILVDTLSTNHGPFADYAKYPIEIKEDKASVESSQFRLWFTWDNEKHELTYQFYNPTPLGPLLPSQVKTISAASLKEALVQIKSDEFVISTQAPVGQESAAIFQVRARVSCP